MRRMSEIWVTGWIRTPNGTIRGPKVEHSGILVEIAERESKEMMKAAKKAGIIRSNA